MSYCKNCGTEIEDGVKFCPSCGTATDEGAHEPSGKSFADSVADLNNTADTTAEFDAKDIEDNKVMALLSYIGPLFLVPMLAASHSKYARYHANQGLMLFLAEVILGAVSGILGLIPFVGWIFGLVTGVASLAGLILGIVNAANGRAKELPLIGHIRLYK